MHHRQPCSHRGSSPRIRGEWCFCCGVCVPCRIIPANTGRMWLAKLVVHSGWDHPREYGENESRVEMLAEKAGSSPRIRGECDLMNEGYYLDRIIPANTGRIQIEQHFQNPFGDHPREYGENPHNSTASFQPLGSSPRIRGECPMFVAAYDGEGIIPANTGRIRFALGSFGARRDHPREYGENPLKRGAPLGPDGSSPRIRGECRFCADRNGGRGIIPANTGRIIRTTDGTYMDRDHPREYGENFAS